MWKKTSVRVHRKAKKRKRVKIEDRFVSVLYLFQITWGAYLSRKTRTFWLENEMVHTIPFESFQKLYAIDLIKAFFSFRFELSN